MQTTRNGNPDFGVRTGGGGHKPVCANVKELAPVVGKSHAGKMLIHATFVLAKAPVSLLLPRHLRVLYV